MKKIKIIILINLMLSLILCVACSDEETSPSSQSFSTSQVDIEKVILSSSNVEESNLVGITIINETGLTFKELNISPAKEVKWGENLLLENSIDSSGIIFIEFYVADGNSLWDFRATDNQECEYVWENLDLSNISKLFLSLNGGIPQASWENKVEKE